MGRISKGLALTWIFSLGIIFCNLPRLHEPQYSHEYDEERKKLGLPIIPDDWKMVGISQEHVIWRDPERDKKIENRVPFHAFKIVDYKSGVLQRETDRYYGVEDYRDPDRVLQREYLVITYYYQVDGDEQSRWRISLMQDERKDGDIFQDGKISLEEAEEILAEWGIERLNY